MTNQHPITPPPELAAKLCREASAGRDDAPIGEIFNHGVYLAYAAGADQELEEVLVEMKTMHFSSVYRDKLRDARRPKPPSLKDQALEQLEGIATCFRATHMGDLVCDKIRRALEALDD